MAINLFWKEGAALQVIWLGGMREARLGFIDDIDDIPGFMVENCELNELVDGKEDRGPPGRLGFV